MDEFGCVCMNVGYFDVEFGGLDGGWCGERWMDG